MATTFFLRDAASDLGGAGQKLLATTRGAASVGKITNTVASGTNIQVTDTAGGQALTWFTQPLAAVTISGTVTVNLRARESASAANAGGGILVQRTDGAGNVVSAILNDVTVPTAITEYSSVADAAKNGTYTPTSTTLSAGDRIKVTLKVRNVGTMGGAQTVTNTIDGPTGGAAGDTFVTFTETITVAAVSGTALAAFTFTAAAAGETGTPPVEGQASGEFTFTGTASGVRGTTGQAVATLAFSGVSAGTVTVSGAAISAVTFTAAAVGARTVFGQAVTTATFTATAAGVPTVFGQGVAALSFTGTASGAAGPTVVTGTAVAALGFVASAAGRVLVIRPSTGTVSRPDTGTTSRPATGTTVRPATGTITRPSTGIVERP